MASLSTDEKGYQRILYFRPADGKRKTLYIGRLTDAERFLKDFESLLAYLETGEPFGPAIVTWIASLSADLAKKLAKAKLIPPRPTEKASPTVCEYVDTFVAKKTHAKASTRSTAMHTLNAAVTAVGPHRKLSDVGESTAVQMINSMTASGYAKAYIAKAVSLMRSMFRTAMRERLVDSNPFEFVKAGAQVNNGRKVFIEAEMIETLIDTLPGTEWPLLVALARWGGLRTPSEPFALTWDHVLWDQSKLIVPTPKLEHIPGRETRTIPLFPEIKSRLDARWDDAGEGETHVFPRLRKLAGIGTLLRKRIKAAGLKPWPRTWQNLRASRATELADRFPSHVAAAWLGHTAEIADKHYRSVLDSHFAEALKTTQNPTQTIVKNGGQPMTASPAGNAKTPGKQRVSGVSQELQDYPARIRNSSENAEKTGRSASGDAESDAVLADPALQAAIDAVATIIANLSLEQRTLLLTRLAALATDAPRPQAPEAPESPRPKQQRHQRRQTPAG